MIKMPIRCPPGTQLYLPHAPPFRLSRTGSGPALSSAVALIAALPLNLVERSGGGAAEKGTSPRPRRVVSAGGVGTAYLHQKANPQTGAAERRLTIRCM